MTCNYLRMRLGPMDMVAILKGSGFRLPWVLASIARNCLQFTYLWGPSWSKKHIYIFCDNLPVVSIINSKRSKSPWIMNLVPAFTILTFEHHFSFANRHIPGLDNSVADSLSRFQMDRFRQLAPYAPYPFPCIIPPSAISI